MLEDFQIQDAIARIKNARGEVVGTGFLVNNDCVLTCAHVIYKAWEGLNKDDIKALKPPVNLDFFVVDPNIAVTAKVVMLKNPTTEEDIACLKLTSPKPAGVKPAPLRISNDLVDHRFRTGGFPDGFNNLCKNAGGLIRGKSAIDLIQIEDDKDPGARIVQGFSGAPVWDEKLDGVVAMISQENTDAPEKMALAIPCNVIASVCTDLKIESLPNQIIGNMRYTFNDFPSPFISKENNLDFVIAYGADYRDYEAYLDELKRLRQPKPVYSPHAGRRCDLDYLPRLISEFSFYAAKQQIKNQPKISFGGQLLIARQGFLLSENEKMENIISIGSGAVNEITRDVLEAHGDNLPARFDKPDNDQFILYSGGGKDCYDSRFDQDVGFIELAPNPYNEEKVVLIVAGLHHTGTQAAILALCQAIEDGEFADQSIEFKGEKKNFPVQLVKATEQNIEYSKGNSLARGFTLIR